MITKSIDQYFEQARSIPVVMSFEEVQALVKIKGVTISHQSWWKTKNFIFMTTTAILLTTVIMIFVSSEETEHIPEIKKEQNDDLENKSIKEQTLILDQDASEIEKVQELIEKSYLKNLNKKKPLLTGKKEVQLINNEISSLSKPFDIEDPIIDFQSAIFPIMPIKNIVIADTLSKLSKLGSDTKLITKETSAIAIDLVDISNYNGDIAIKTWDKPVVKMDAYVTITGGNKEDIEKALEDFDLNLVANGSKLEIENDWSKHHDCKCSETTIKGKLTTKKGEKIKVKKYKIDYVLTVPTKMNLAIKDNYGNVTLENISGNVTVSSFQGNFTAGNIDGKIDLKMKYGDVEVGDSKGGKVRLFHSKSNFGASKKIVLDAKYSTVGIAQIDELELKAFQTNIKIEKEVKKISGNLKYGGLTVGGNANIIDMVVFQVKINVKDVNEFEVEGSYSNFKAMNIKNLYIATAFQNSYRIGSVGTIKGVAKYTSFDIGVLKTELDLKTFQGKIDIDEVLGTFQKMDINAKYTPLDLTFSADAKFNINAQTTYTDFDYPENLMQVDEKIKENQKMTFKGVFNAANNKEPSMVNVVSFQGKLNLR